MGIISKIFDRSKESRANYTEAKILASEGSVQGNSADIKNTAAVATASGLVGRSLAVAKIKPDQMSTAFNASMLYDLGKALIEDGEALYRIEIQAGRINLERASAWTITGSPWFYNIETPIPGGQSRSYVSSAEGVFHPRMNVTSLEPWKGRGANAIAGQTASLLASLERLMSNELAGGSGYIIPMPPKLTPSQSNALSDLVKKLKGGSAFVPNGSGRDNLTPAGIWQQKRIGADFPATYDTLRSDLSESIQNSLGLPKALFATGGSSREANRFFLHSTLSPIIEIIKVEARDKLNAEIDFNLDGLFSSDITGRARSFASMTKAGMDIQKAAILSGLITEDDDGI